MDRAAELALDVAAIREDFPILSAPLPGRGGGAGSRLVYLDNAATTQKPRAVIDALVSYYSTMNANVHRAIHTLGEAATAAFEASRRSVARFIGAAKPEEVIFTRGATEAINLVASAWGRANVGAGDEIALTEMEHHSNLVPWQLLARERGAMLRFMPFGDDGVLELDRLDSLLTERTKLVACTHVSNVLGTINDVASIIAAAHERGIPVLIDAAQSVPHMPVDVAELDCDFLAFSGHKMYGPTGIGILYGKERLLDAMPPYQGGGEMIRSVWLDHATWNDLPYKFEAGTPDIAGAVGLGAAVDYLSRLGMRAIRQYESMLAQRALDIVSDLDGVTVYGRAADRGAVVAFNTAGIHAHDVAQFLDSRGIAVRAGHHCAYPLMRKLGVAATARASLAIYNTLEELDCLADGLRGAMEYFRRDAR